MKRCNLRLMIVRAAAAKGLTQALAASALLFASSCNSVRSLATRGNPSRTDPFVHSASAAEGVTHADLATNRPVENSVTPLAHQTELGDPVVSDSAAEVAAQQSPSSPRDFPSNRAEPRTADRKLQVAAADATDRQSPPLAPRTFPTVADHADPFASQLSVPAVQQVHYEALHAAAATSDSSTAPTASEPAPTVQPHLSVTAAAADHAPMTAPAPLASDASSPVVAYADEPRVPLSHVPADCPPSGCPPLSVPAGVTAAFPHPSTIGDEYLCDGGDHGLPLHYNGPTRAGLEPEDTIVEFAGHAVARASGTHEGTPLGGLRGRTVLDEKVQRDALHGARTWSRASGTENEMSDSSLVKHDRHSLHEKLIGAFQDYGFLRDGAYHKIDSAVLQQAVEAAFAWSTEQGTVVYAHDQTGQLVEGRAMAEDMTGIEDRRRPGQLRVVKVADRKAAHPGDVVTFTVRFDNVGDRELLNVRLVDHLSPRLKFVEGSVESNVQGTLRAEPGGSGGTILTFEFAEPLAGRSGVYVSFRCTVL